LLGRRKWEGEKRKKKVCYKKIEVGRKKLPTWKNSLRLAQGLGKTRKEGKNVTKKKARTTSRSIVIWEE